MEKRNIWKEGFDNNKTFILYTNIYTNDTKLFINGCKNCDKIVKVTNTGIERQLIGNCYQSLCNCSECNNYMVYDEYKLDTLEFYLTNIDRINKEHTENLRIGKHINIFPYELESNILKPIEIITDFEPYTYNHIHGNIVIDKLYIYISESKTNDLADNPLNNYQQDCQTNYHAIIDIKDKQLYRHYPTIKGYYKNSIVENILIKYCNLIIEGNV